MDHGQCCTDDLLGLTEREWCDCDHRGQRCHRCRYHPA
ncbi:Uncharacterised protein [Vibrio cholerae]|nr:Uncharacterised protein [Vibrio cholerae]